MKNKFSIVLCSIIFWTLILGCSNNTQTSSNNKNIPKPTETPKETKAELKAIVDVPKLANKTPEDFEKDLGKAVSITKITKTPEEMPGEFRHYKLRDLGDDTLQVRFYQGKAVSFNINLPKDRQVKTAQELVALAGIKVEKGEEVSPYATQWKGSFNGVSFSEITALKSKVDDYYNLSVKTQ